MGEPNNLEMDKVKVFGTHHAYINGKQVRVVAQAKSFRQFWLKLREAGLCHCGYQALKDYTSETHNVVDIKAAEGGGIYYTESRESHKPNQEYVEWKGKNEKL